MRGPPFDGHFIVSILFYSHITISREELRATRDCYVTYRYQARNVLCMYGTAFFLNYVTVSGQYFFSAFTSIKIRSLIADRHGHFFEAQSRLSVDL